MESTGQIILLILSLIIVASIVGACYSVSRRRTQQRKTCPRCHKAWPDGFTQCPFCHYVPTTSHVSSPAPAQRGSVYLSWGEGAPRGGMDVPLRDKLLIGRSMDCDVRIESILVSRHHARVVREGADWVVYDEESTNGTYVNNRRVAQAILQVGDRLRVGPAELTFHRAGEAAQPVAPQIAAPVPAYTPGQSLQQLGNYTLIRQLGGGGMARVYLAQTPAQKTVAVKVFFQTDPYLVNKFRQEGVLNLQHPHIVQVYECGEAGQTMYLVMEYIEGTDLRTLLAPRKPLPLDLVVPLVGQTCEALDYAHSHGVIHRDIKPENIRLSASAGVKLLDFGIAKVTGSVQMTSDGMLIGTPYYMSYEQAHGEQVVPASDIYSLGVVMYEMLTGQVPFDGDGVPLKVIEKHLTSEPTGPRKLNPAISHEVEDIVLRCLSKDLGQRFGSARELESALGYKRGSTLPPFHYTPAPQEPARPARSPVPISGASSWPGAAPAPGAAATFSVLSTPARTMAVPAGGFLTRREIAPGDLTISRNHAQILWQEGRFVLLDCSTYGTWVNGQRLLQGQRIPLHPGAQIRIGQSALRYEGP